MTTSTWFRLAAVGALLGPTACGAPAPAEEPAPPPAPTAEGPGATSSVVSSDALCEAYCDRWDACGKPAEHCSCQAAGKDLSVFNASYLGRLMLCVDGVPCASLDAGTAWSACHDTTLNALPTSKKLRAFCFASAHRAAECGTPNDADQSACLVTFRHVSDAAIDTAEACLEQACGEVPKCVAWALSPRDGR